MKERRSFSGKSGVHSGKNVAVFEYATETGELNTLAKTSQFPQHSERLAATELLGQGVDPNQVARIYSEFNFCSSPPIVESL
jgi:hypothetical protein